jgi:predicted Zn finger-like uncharacterized protein
MKIVCESCGAKYSIADEKVAGKVFKIRCKKCSAVIVVKGENPEGEESTRVYDYGAEAVWHVVVAGEQQGPLAPRQIGELLSENKIDWEAYVWREGMDGWQPAREVENLVSAVMADSQGAGGPKAGAAYGTGQVFGGSSDMGADPFASDDGGLSGVMAQQAASGGGGGADLFAKSARSPFSGSSDDEERAPAASGSSPRVHPGEAALTGQRNENSVLFSLSNLQALATGSGSTPTATSARPGMAVGEGSGLIDIRALASATQSVSDKPNGSSRDKVEDLLSVGAGGAGFSAASFAVAPVSEKADTGKLILVGMAAAILLLGGAVTYLVLRQPPQQVIAATTPAPTDMAAAPAAGQAVAAPTPQAQAPEAADERQPSEAEGAPSGRGEHDRESGRRAEGSAPRKAGGRDAPKAADNKPEPAAAPEPAPAPRKSGDQSIDDLLSGALGKSSKPAAPAKPVGESLPPTPSRDDVLTALKSVAPRVSACGGGQSGLATAKISVAGATGRVTGVDVSGQFAGTPVASCVAKEVGKAKFPRFATPTFAVTFPFKI